MSQTLPLKINAGNRYLEDQSGTPVLLNGDAAWSLIVQVPYPQADLYLTDRKTRGYNAILVNLIEHYFSDYAPGNANGDLPFTGASFATPNENYFSHADSVIDRANQLGITVFLFPVYLGYAGTQEGWITDVQAASAATMRQWGQYVGNRYKNYPNIVWVIGGDANPALTPEVQAKVDTMVAALKSADTIYPNRLTTTHSERETQAYTHWPEAWVTLNNFYSKYSTVCANADVSYDHAPTTPFFMMEGYYEEADDENAAVMTPQKIRAQAYWTILRGGCGHFYGHALLWALGSTTANVSPGTTWQMSLASAGSVSMTNFAQLFAARHWSMLVPDRTAKVLTSGAGTGTDAAVAAYTTDSSSIIAYLPSQRNVTVNPAVLKGDSIHVYWYNPSDGVCVDGGVSVKTARSYTQPFAGDWVFVIDAKAGDLSLPGTASGFTLLSPINGEPAAAVTSTLAWNAVAGASSYRLQLSADPGFAAFAINQNGITSTSYTPTGLLGSSTYYWRVIALNTDGSSISSPSWRFTTVAPSLLAPSLATPSDGATGVTTTPTLAWTASVGATSYQVQISKDALFTATVLEQSNITAPTYSPVGLTAGTVYYWRVKASSSSGTSANSSVWSFTTAAPVVLPTTTVIYTDNALTSPWSDNRSRYVTLSYVNTSPVNQGTSSMRVAYTSSSASLQFSQGTTGSYVSIDPTLYQTLDFAVYSKSRCTLKVSVLNAAGNTILTTVSYSITANTWQVKSIPMSLLSTMPFISIQFTTTSSNGTYYLDNISLALKPTGPTLPAAPVLRSPVNAAVNQLLPPILTWNASRGATAYHLQVSTDSLFSAMILNDSTLTDTSRSVAGIANSTSYFWRVSAKNTVGSSAFSAAWKFTTIVSAPSTPQLLLPSNAGIDIAAPVTLQWTGVVQAATYRLQLAMDPSFSSVVLDDSTITATSRVVASLQSLTTYYWRVNAKNAGGTSVYSSAWSFVSAGAPPAAPLLSSPADGAVNQPVNVGLAWYRSATAASYHVQVARDSLFASVIADQSTLADSSLQLASLANLTKYFWRVSASNSYGASAFTGARRFTTVVPDPVSPVLVSPVNTAVNQSTAVTLSWTASPNASAYNVQLATDALFSSPIINDSTVTGTTRAVASLQNGTSYYWRVRSQNAAGKSAFSPIWKFTTAAVVAATVNYIYQEQALTAPWNDVKSWNTTRKYTSTTPVFQGTTSAQVVYKAGGWLIFTQGSWGAFVPFTPTLYKSLEFAVYGGTTGFTLYVSCMNVNGANILTPVVFAVPAKTWIVKSILMSQLANVPFVAVGFNIGSSVTAAFDNIGLVYAESAVSASTTSAQSYDANAAPLTAESSTIGTLDGRSVSLFAAGWKNHDLHSADIAAARGDASSAAVQRDGVIDANDYAAFRALWELSQATVDSRADGGNVDGPLSDDLGSMSITSSRKGPSAKDQTVSVHTLGIDSVQTVEMTLRYDPAKIAIADIAPAYNGEGTLVFTRIDNSTGTAVCVIASTSVPFSGDVIAAGKFDVKASRLSASGGDTLSVELRAYSESSEMILHASQHVCLQSTAIPEVYELSQNYPNPFNPSTTIRFSLPMRSRVRLEIFSSLGQAVTVLIDKDVEAGYQEVVWNGGLASGMYFYRLDAVAIDDPGKHFSTVKRMLYLK